MPLLRHLLHLTGKLQLTFRCISSPLWLFVFYETTAKKTQCHNTRQPLKYSYRIIITSVNLTEIYVALFVSQTGGECLFLASHPRHGLTLWLFYFLFYFEDIFSCVTSHFLLPTFVHVSHLSDCLPLLESRYPYLPHEYNLCAPCSLCQFPESVPVSQCPISPCFFWLLIPLVFLVCTLFCFSSLDFSGYVFCLCRPCVVAFWDLGFHRLSALFNEACVWFLTCLLVYLRFGSVLSNPDTPLVVLLYNQGEGGPIMFAIVLWTICRADIVPCFFFTSLVINT